MKCEKCEHENANDARYCKQCGEAIADVGVVKGEKVFVADSRRSEGGFLCFGEDEQWDNSRNGMIVGIVFIGVAIIMTLAMTGIFRDFGNTIGNFFGDFGTNMGQIGEDIGAFFSNWGTNFGTAVENFFGGVEWWKIIQPIIVLGFLLVGIVLIYRNYREQNR